MATKPPPQLQLCANSVCRTQAATAAAAACRALPCAKLQAYVNADPRLAFDGCFYEGWRNGTMQISANVTVLPCQAASCVPARPRLARRLATLLKPYFARQLDDAGIPVKVRHRRCGSQCRQGCTCPQSRCPRLRPARLACARPAGPAAALRSLLHSESGARPVPSQLTPKVHCAGQLVAPGLLPTRGPGFVAAVETVLAGHPYYIRASAPPSCSACLSFLTIYHVLDGGVVSCAVAREITRAVSKVRSCLPRAGGQGLPPELSRPLLRQF